MFVTILRYGHFLSIDARSAKFEIYSVYSAISTAEDPRTNAPLVRSAAVQASSDVSRSFTGVVAARVQGDLGFRVSGKVLERLVDTGQTVKRGQPLMRLDPIDLGSVSYTHLTLPTNREV